MNIIKTFLIICLPIGAVVLIAIVFYESGYQQRKLEEENERQKKEERITGCFH